MNIKLFDEAIEQLQQLRIQAEKGKSISEKDLFDVQTLLLRSGEPVQPASVNTEQLIISFDPKEREIIGLIVQAHNKFIELKRSHPSEMTEWVNDIHRLQSLLSMRVLRRLFPDDFA